MSFWISLEKKVSDAGRGVAQQTKNLTEIARLTSVIDTEEKMVAQSYTHRSARHIMKTIKMTRMQNVPRRSRL